VVYAPGAGGAALVAVYAAARTLADTGCAEPMGRPPSRLGSVCSSLVRRLSYGL